MADRNNFSWGVYGQGEEGKDWGSTHGWDDAQWQQYEGKDTAAKPTSTIGTGAWPAPSNSGAMEKPPATTSALPPPSTTSALPTRPNFSWIENGVSKNTNNWGEAEWRQYYKEHPDDPYARQVGAPPAPAPTGGGTPTTPPVDPKADLMKLLTDRMHQTLEIDKNDPIIKQQADSYKANEERARRDMLADAAEAGGRFSTGGQRGMERMASERMGQRTGMFESQLVAQELGARRSEIKDAIDSMGNLLTEGERQALQKELAELDASIRRQQMDMQNAQFSAQLSQAERHFLKQLEQQGRFAEMDDAFRRMQLGQNDSQWRDQIGFNEQQERNKWDWLQRGN
jgi:hypothetical protein